MIKVKENGPRGQEGGLGKKKRKKEKKALRPTQESNLRPSLTTYKTTKRIPALWEAKAFLRDEDLRLPCGSPRH